MGLNWMAIPQHQPSLPVILIAIVLTGSAVHAAEPATRPAQMMYADQTRLGRPFAKDPCVIRFRARYWLY